jgi:hypothetical protein
LALGEEIKITIVEENEAWLKLKEDLRKISGNSNFLYQQIPHPDFNEWGVYKNNITKDFLISELVYGNVMDIGICHGGTLYRLKLANRISNGTGIEVDETRYKIAKIIFDKIQILGRTSKNGMKLPLIHITR